MVNINAFWGIEYNPFQKEMSHKGKVETTDLKEASARLNYLSKIKGIGLFTGASGTGKTFFLKDFTDGLNPSLYKVIYQPLSSLTNLDFFKSISSKLGVQPLTRKSEIFHSIQERVVFFNKEKNITPVIILDEAQEFNSKILTDLKLFTNFNMDSKSNLVLLLTGLPVLNNTLELAVHEALKQRIVVKYNFNGISKSEIDMYIKEKLKFAGCQHSIFSAEAIEALFSCCNGFMRVLNNLCTHCLLIASSKKIENIDTDIVMLAQGEIDLT